MITICYVDIIHVNCRLFLTRPRGVLPTVAHRFVIKKPRGRVGHSPRWAAEPDGIIKLVVFF
jgi:hypothetical protein